MKVNLNPFIGVKIPQQKASTAFAAEPFPAAQDSVLLTASPNLPNLIQKSALSTVGPAEQSQPASTDFEVAPQTLGFTPLLNAVQISPEKRKTKVPVEVLDKAEEYLYRGDRGAAYLTVYQELGNEQILIQTGITTYTGFWGSGALTGNHLAMQNGGSRYNTQLDEFSVEIAKATLDAVRKDLDAGGTGRLSDDQFQSADRKVWKDKDMGELFPGNVQFMDFWNHDEGDRAEAFFSKSTLSMVGAGARALVPNTSFLGLNEDGRNLNSLAGKRPSEYAGDPNYTVHGGENDRFLTVVDNKTGFIEAFWDKKPRIAGFIRLRQIDDVPMAKDSPEHLQRKKLYDELGANRHRPA